MLSSLPELTTATASSMAHNPNSSINSNTSRTLLLACTPPWPHHPPPPETPLAPHPTADSIQNIPPHSQSPPQPGTSLPYQSAPPPQPVPYPLLLWRKRPHSTTQNQARNLGQQSLLSSCPLPLELPPQTHQRLYYAFKTLTKTNLSKIAFTCLFLYIFYVLFLYFCFNL